MSFRRQLKATFKDLFGGGGDKDKGDKAKEKKRSKDKKKGNTFSVGQLAKGSLSSLGLHDESPTPNAYSIRNEEKTFKQVEVKSEKRAWRKDADDDSKRYTPPNAGSGAREKKEQYIGDAEPYGECDSEKRSRFESPLPGFKNLNVRAASDPEGPWEKALSKLSARDRIDLIHRPTEAGEPPSEQTVISAILAQSQALLDQSEKKAWKFKSPFTGETIHLREKVQKFAARVNTYTQLGDIAAQNSPRIAAFAWGGVRFLIKMIVTDAENWGLLMETMEGIASCMGRCKIYEGIYWGSEENGLEGGKRVTEQLVKLYATMLRFSVRTRRYFGSSASKRVVRDYVQPFEIAFKPIIEQLRQDEEALEREARTAAEELAARERNDNRAQNAAQTALLHRLEAILSELSFVSITNLTLTVNETNATVQRIRKAQEEEERLAILQWLSKVKYLDHHKAARKVRQEGTGKWFFERREWKEWVEFIEAGSASEVEEAQEVEDGWWVDLEEFMETEETQTEQDKKESSGLWLYGLPGTGKTILTSNVIDHLSNLIRPAFPASPVPEALLSYFYCSYTETPRRQVISLMAAILKQLATNLNPHPDDDQTGLGLPKTLVSTYRSHKEQGFSAEQLDLAEMEEIIHKEILPSPGLKKVYIVIDALDEMEESSRKELFPILSRLINHEGTCRVKIFIASRGGMRDIKNAFEKERWINMGLAKEDTGADIKSFVVCEIEKALDSGELLEGEMEEELKNEIIQTLVKGADGMFLWVRYQISHICEQETEYDIAESLKNLPRGLEQTYSSLLEKINIQSANRKRLAERVLKWMLCSARPLTPRELAEAVAIEPTTDTELNPKKLVKGVEAIVGICGNFIAYDEQTGVLRFVHFSVREYLERTFCTVDDAHMAVAEVCVALLCFEQEWRLLEKSGVDIEEKKADDDKTSTGEKTIDERKELAVAEYVVLQWGYHTKVSMSHHSPESDLTLQFLGNLVRKFFDTKNKYFLRWLLFFQSLNSAFRIHLFEPGVDKLYPDPLFIACHFGLLPVAEHLISTGLFSPNGLLLAENEPEKTNSLNWTYLHLAAATSAHHIISILINELKADPNPLDVHGRNPLHIVASSRRSCPGGAVIFLSHDEALTVKNLIGFGTEPMQQDTRNKAMPMHLASESGNISVIRALAIYTETLNSKLPIFNNIWSAKDIWGKTLLHAAVTSKRVLPLAKYQVVMHLIGLGSPVNVKDSFNRNAIERLLIECPMEVNTMGQFLYDVGVEFDEAKLAPGVPKMVMGKKVAFKEFGKNGHFGTGHVMHGPQVGWWRNLNAGWIGRKGMGNQMAMVQSLGDRGFREKVRIWCEVGK